MNTMNQDVLVNKLIDRGIIIRARRGFYFVTVLGTNRDYSRKYVVEKFSCEMEPGRYIFKNDNVSLYTPNAEQLRMALEALGKAFTPVNAPRPVRRIRRHTYQSQARNITEALDRLEEDADGVKRSYGIEYEIGGLTPEQESELAYLLDTLPPHVTEADSSLSSTGVEIVFEPMSKEVATKTVATLRKFVIDNGVDMRNAGMHTTYGVSNGTTSRTDLVIRLNRVALAIKSVGLRENIKSLFGRDFSYYCCLPNSLTDENRYRAFNVRNSSAFEARLIQWDADFEKVTELFSILEVLFYRMFTAEEFIKLFNLLGGTADGQ